MVRLTLPSLRSFLVPKCLNDFVMSLVTFHSYGIVSVSVQEDPIFLLRYRYNYNMFWNINLEYTDNRSTSIARKRGMFADST